MEVDYSDALKTLQQRLDQNEQENRDIRDEIKRIKLVVSESHKTNNEAWRTTEKKVQGVMDEVLIVNGIVSKIEKDVTALKEASKSPHQDTSSQSAVLQAIAELSAQVAQITSKHIRAANKQALDQLLSFVQRIGAEATQKLKEPVLERMFQELIAAISEGWRDRVNSDEDVTSDIAAMTPAIQKDVQGVVDNASRWKSVAALFTQFCSSSQYLPQKPKANKIEKEFVHVNGSSHSQSSSVAKQPNIYFDASDIDLPGLSSYITQCFPNATPYSYSNLQSPCVILTFIIVNDRIDMNRWKTICSARNEKTENHFVILVCNKLGDATGADGLDKLTCKALYKTEFSLEVDKTGMKRPAKLLMNKSSFDVAFATIKSQI